MASETTTSRIGQSIVLETVVSDDDLQRTISTAPPACDEERLPEPPLSSGVMKAFKRAKRAAEAYNIRCRQIVRQQYRERMGDDAGAPAPARQTTLGDFKTSKVDRGVL